MAYERAQSGSEAKSMKDEDGAFLGRNRIVGNEPEVASARGL